jgi:nicotinamidase-related amidase
MGDVLVDAVPPSAVHLCVDMQRIFSSDGPWPTPWMERVLPTVTRIAERFPERTVFTRFITRATPADAIGRWRSYYESRAFSPAIMWSSHAQLSSRRRRTG